jgi:hypothetical protein
MGRSGALCLGLFVGCLHPAPRATPAAGLETRSFKVAFERAGLVQVDCEVLLPAGPIDVRQVSWTLTVMGRVFAVGLDGAPQVARQPDGQLYLVLRLPLVVKHVTWEEGPRYVAAALRGHLEAVHAGVEQRLAFEAAGEWLSESTPLPDVRD